MAPASCGCEPQRIVGGCAICNGASVVSDALQTLVDRIDAHFRTAPNRSYGKNPYELSEVEWSQLRALAQTRQFGEREG